jgi:hypothetical protein
MLEIRDSENEIAEGGQYARTEEELYQKAIALLERCRIEPRHPGQELPERRPGFESSSITSEHPRTSVTG